MPPISGERRRRSPKWPRMSSSRPRSAARVRADVHEARGRGRLAADRDRGQLDACRQRRGKARAHRVADVDHGVLEAGQPEQPRLRLGIALHRPVVVEVVARQVAERGDAHAHGVDAALVERVRGHFHRDVRRAGVRERAQLPVQRDDVRRGQRAAVRPAAEIPRRACRGTRRAARGARPPTASSHAQVVLPLVPVTPATVSRDDGMP